MARIVTAVIVALIPLADWCAVYHPEWFAP